MGKNGSLTLLGLPIGNTLDLTQRVEGALREGCYFLCEDTRRLKNLMRFLEIPLEGKKIISFHDHSSEKKLSFIKELTVQGEDVFYCSDAGSPIISDPGFDVVKYCHKNDIKVETFPAVCSVIAALELSALAPLPFSFHGFVPREKKGQEVLVQKVKSLIGTHIFFESKYRLLNTLEFFSNNFLENDFFVVKELTKDFQKTYAFKGKDYDEHRDLIDLRGEFIFLLHHNEQKKKVDLKLAKLAGACVESLGKKKDLSKLLAEILDQDQNEIFKALSAKR